MKHFILMGDIIGSSGKNHPKLMDDFDKTVSFANQKHKRRILSPLTITLGDEFQGIVKDADSAGVIIIAMEEFIIENRLGFKLRYVLNQGKINTPVNKTRSYKMLGEGLADARKQLERLKKSGDRFRFFLEDTENTLVVNLVFRIIKNVAGKWNVEKDHEIISSFLKHKDYKIVAEKLGKSRSQVWKREKSLGFDSYFTAKEILTTILDA